MSPRIHADVLVAGAGPAGLGFALGCDRTEFGGSIHIVDGGRPHVRRICPVDHGRRCNGCNSVCNVFAGFGGSIHYGDGVKLSSFPSGRRLQALLGDARGSRHMTSALELLFGASDVDHARFRLPGAADLPFDLKHYPVLSLDASSVRRIVDRLHTLVDHAPNLRLDMETEIVEIQPKGRRFEVRCRRRSPRSEVVIEAGHVVVGVGRKGFLWWREELRRLGLDHREPTASVGLRFECPARYLAAAAEVHADFKTTVHDEDLKFKTFCFCAGDRGGRIKFTDYGPYVLLDGHVASGSDAAQETANFALLAQLRAPDGKPRSFDWIRTNLLEPYRRLSSPERAGKPVLTWYPDFARGGALTCTSLDDFARRAGFRPSVGDLELADLASVLPEGMAGQFARVFERLFRCFVDLGSTSERLPLDQVGVLGLELEGLWDEVAVSSQMESSIDNLFVIGDCAGVAQGILQAAASGLAAAERFAERKKAIA